MTITRSNIILRVVYLSKSLVQLSRYSKTCFPSGLSLSLSLFIEVSRGTLERETREKPSSCERGGFVIAVKWVTLDASRNQDWLPLSLPLSLSLSPSSLPSSAPFASSYRAGFFVVRLCPCTGHCAPSWLPCRVFSHLQRCNSMRCSGVDSFAPRVIRRRAEPR